MRATAAGVVIAVLLVTTGRHTAAQPQAALTVRLYNSARIPADELTAARAVGEAILRDTGLDTRFRNCGSTTDSCDELLKRSEVVVRVVDAPVFNATLDPEAYGVTYIVKATNRGWLATLFSDRIRTAARRAGVDTGTVLGRVMAHEIGHLLLGVDYHGAVGVMRAEWPDDALNSDAGNWRFSMLEVERIQHVVASFGSFEPHAAF